MTLSLPSDGEETYAPPESQPCFHGRVDERMSDSLWNVLLKCWIVDKDRRIQVNRLDEELESTINPLLS